MIDLIGVVSIFPYFKKRGASGQTTGEINSNNMKVYNKAGARALIMNNDDSWNDIDSIPKDGTEILIRLPEGAVSAWYYRSQRTGDWWVCFDDMFRLEGDDNNIIGWKPFRR